MDIDLLSKLLEKPFIDPPNALMLYMVKSVAIDMCLGNLESALPLNEDGNTAIVCRFVSLLANPTAVSIVWFMPYTMAFAVGAMGGGMGEDDFGMVVDVYSAAGEDVVLVKFGD